MYHEAVEMTVLVPTDRIADVYKILTGEYAAVHVTAVYDEALRTGVGCVTADTTGKVHNWSERIAATADALNARFEEALVLHGKSPTFGGTTPVQAGEEVDSAGWPWRADLHAGSKGKTKDGLWRMKTGVERPAPLPTKVDAPVEAVEPFNESFAEPVEASEAFNEAAGLTVTEPVTEAVVTAPDFDEEEELWAKAASDAEEAVVVPTREWSDQDLASAASQSVTAMGGEAMVPAVKALVADFVPEGSMPHSRNIPAEDRAKFIEALEKLVRTTTGKDDFSIAG